MIKAICTQFRNESNKICDWFEYYINEGFNAFILFDDHSDDNIDEKIQYFLKKYDNIKLYYHITDIKDNVKLYNNSLETNIYQNDSSLHHRISQSFLSGFDIFKSISIPNELNYCCFVDIDEIIISNYNEKITKIIENNFVKRKVEHLYIQSYDVNTIKIENDLDIFRNEQTQYRWSQKNREEFLNGKYSYRGKSIVTNNHNFICSPQNYWSIIHCGGCIGNDFRSAVSVEKVPPEEELRINHYRIPPNDNSVIFDEFDNFVFNKFKNLKS